MSNYDDDDVRYKEVTMHDFKTNISKYVKEMEAGAYRAVVVHRYKKPLGMFLLMDYLTAKVEEDKKT